VALNVFSEEYISRNDDKQCTVSLLSGVNISDYLVLAAVTDYLFSYLVDNCKFRKKITPKLGFI